MVGPPGRKDPAALPVFSAARANRLQGSEPV